MNNGLSGCSRDILTVRSLYGSNCNDTAPSSCQCAVWMCKRSCNWSGCEQFKAEIKSKLCSCAGPHGGIHPMAWKNLWSSQDTGLIAIIIILMSLQPEAHTLAALLTQIVFLHGGARRSQGPMVRTDSVRGRGGDVRKRAIHQKVPGGFKGMLLNWRIRF